MASSNAADAQQDYGSNEDLIATLNTLSHQQFDAVVAAAVSNEESRIEVDLQKVPESTKRCSIYPENYKLDVLSLASSVDHQNRVSHALLCGGMGQQMCRESQSRASPRKSVSEGYSDWEAVLQAVQNNDPLTLSVMSSNANGGRTTRSSHTQSQSQLDTGLGIPHGGEEAPHQDQANLMQHPVEGSYDPQQHYQASVEFSSDHDHQNGMYQHHQGNEQALPDYHPSATEDQYGLTSGALGHVTSGSILDVEDTKSTAKGKGRAKSRKSLGEDELDGEPDGDGKGPKGVKMDEASRKFQHKEVERRRREAINEGIARLSEIVPDCDSKATHKGVIISKAVDYIYHLKASEASNIEKWTLEKLLMDQAMNSLTEQLKEAERTIEVLREEREVLMGAGVSIESGGGYGDHGQNGNGDEVGEGRDHDEEDEESRKRRRR